MGDFSAKVGNDNKNYDMAMRREGCGTYENGERLFKFCTTNDLVLPKWQRQEPDRPPDDKWNVETIAPGSQSEEGS